MTELDLNQIETIVKSAILEGIQNCPFGKDREIRVRELEEWRQQRNGESRVYQNRKRDFLYPLYSAFLAAFFMFLIMLYWPTK